MVERESNSTMPFGEQVDSDIDIEIGSFELSFPSIQMDAAASPVWQRCFHGRSAIRRCQELPPPWDVLALRGRTTCFDSLPDEVGAWHCMERCEWVVPGSGDEAFFRL